MSASNSQVRELWPEQAESQQSGRYSHSEGDRGSVDFWGPEPFFSTAGSDEPGSFFVKVFRDLYVLVVSPQAAQTHHPELRFHRWLYQRLFWKPFTHTIDFRVANSKYIRHRFDVTYKKRVDWRSGTRSAEDFARAYPTIIDTLQHAVATRGLVLLIDGLPEKADGPAAGGAYALAVVIGLLMQAFAMDGFTASTYIAGQLILPPKIVSQAASIIGSSELMYELASSQLTPPPDLVVPITAMLEELEKSARPEYWWPDLVAVGAILPSGGAGPNLTPELLLDRDFLDREAFLKKYKAPSELEHSCSSVDSGSVSDSGSEDPDLHKLAELPALAQLPSPSSSRSGAQSPSSRGLPDTDGSMTPTRHRSEREEVLRPPSRLCHVALYQILPALPWE